MADPAGHRIWFAAMRNRVGHRRVVTRVAVDRYKEVSDLGDGVRGGTVRNMPRLAVIRRRFEVRRVDGVGPSWRVFRLCRLRQQRAERDCEYSQGDDGLQVLLPALSL
jgi:hypothetical protein